MGDLPWVYLRLSLSGGLERLQAHRDPEMDKEEKMEGWMNCEAVACPAGWPGGAQATPPTRLATPGATPKPKQ